MKDPLMFIKLETTNSDNYGPIFVYINIDTISSMCKYKNSTNIFLIDGTHYVVKESITDIGKQINELYEKI